MRPVHLIGLILWRGGVLLAGMFVFYEAARYVLLFVSLPRQVEVGLALILVGAAFVIASLIVERVEDARQEREFLG